MHTLVLLQTSESELDRNRRLLQALCDEMRPVHIDGLLRR